MDGLAAAEKIAGGRIAPGGDPDRVQPAGPGGAGAGGRRDGVPGEALPEERPGAGDRDRAVAVRGAAALEAEVATLTDRLETRKAVERAKGELMTTYGMTEPQAFKWIQRTAMDHRMTMREVADRIIAETEPPETARNRRA